MNELNKKQMGMTILEALPAITRGWNDLIGIRLKYKDEHTRAIKTYQAQIKNLKTLELELYCFKAGLSKLYEQGWTNPELTTEKILLTKYLIAQTKTYITSQVKDIKKTKKKLQVLQSNIRDFSNIIHEAYVKYPNHSKEKYRVMKTVFKNGMEHIDAVVVKPVQLISIGK